MDMTRYEIKRGVGIKKEKLRPNPWNPNHMNERQQTAVAESIAYFGQVMELLVRPHPDVKGEFQIIDGEHRFNVLPELVYCNVIHGLSEAEAKKLTIVMNETRGNADKIELSQLLAGLEKEMGADLGFGLPYGSDELDELVKLASVDWDNFSQELDFSSENESSDLDDSLITVFAKVSKEAMDVISQASDLIKDENPGIKNQPSDQAWGAIIEILASEYLAR